MDQRGFKRIIQVEADQLRHHPDHPNRHRIMLNSTVQVVRYDASGVEVQLESGRILRAEYVIVTFSLGVLQNDEVVFEPRLPAWKVEAIESMTMVSVGHWIRLLDDRHATFVGHLHQDLPSISAEVLVRHSGE